MKNVLRPGARGPEILMLLKQGGPVSFAALSEMLEPQMKRKRLHRALARLSAKGLIELRNETMFGGRGSFYQITQSPMGRKLAGEILGCHPDELLQPFFRYREIHHNNQSAIIANKLKRQFPEAQVIRDFQFAANEGARRVIANSGNDYNVRPDILLIFPKQDGLNKTTIAFEIEKTRKTDERLTSKLKKLSRSHIDGVVYLCESKRILEAIRYNFQSRVLDQAVRIKHYGNHFVVFSDLDPKRKLPDSKVYSLSGESYSLLDWISYLRIHARTQRSDSVGNLGGT